MSNVLTLARPYARAAFELAKSEDATLAWSPRLGMAAQFAAHADVRDLIGSPKLKPADRIGLFLSEGEEDTSFARFLSLLEANQRLSLLPEIAALFEELRADYERTLRVHVRSALPIDPAQQQQLTGALARRFDRVVTLDISIDPELLGGAVIEAGDVVIDGSLRGKIARMRHELMQ